MLIVVKFANPTPLTLQGGGWKEKFLDKIVGHNAHWEGSGWQEESWWRCLVNPSSAPAPPPHNGGQHLTLANIPTIVPDEILFSIPNIVQENIEQCNAPPLQLGMHPICSASNPGPQSLSQNFYQPCAGAAFLSRIKLPKVCRQHLMHHSSPPKKRSKKKRSAVNYFWIGHHRSFARSTKRFWSSDPDLSINQNRLHFTRRKNWDLPFRKNWDGPVHQTPWGPPSPPSQMTNAAFTTISPNF